MMSHVNLNNANVSPNHVENLSMLASFYSWYFIHLVADVIEFLCLSVAKLMVLDLMSVFAAPQGARPADAVGCSGAGCDGGCSAGQCCGAGGQRCS
jgi:hypothetical protein